MRNSVSVVIPVYNGAAHLAACVESVLAQTLPPSEIVVVDDGSDDATPEVAAALGNHIRYELQAHCGAASARNTGVTIATAEFLAFLDSDDLWMPEKLERQMEALAREPEPAMAFGHVQQFVSDELSSEERAALKYATAPVPGWTASTLVLRRRDFERVGPFDAALQIGEFAEWFARAKDARLQPLMVPEMVCRRRLHRNNLGRRRRDLRGDYARALKNVLDRRRSLP